MRRRRPNGAEGAPDVRVVGLQEAGLAVGAAGGGGVAGRADLAVWLDRVAAVGDRLEAAGGLVSADMVVAAAAAVLAAGVMWALARRVASRRALAPARRVRLMALPTETFDPGAEEVERYAAQLSRTRRAVRGWLTRPAQAVRLRLDAVGNGQCVYRLEGPSTAGSVLRLAGYHEVELRPADDVDATAMSLLAAPVDGGHEAKGPDSAGSDDAERVGRRPEPGRRPSAGADAGQQAR